MSHVRLVTVALSLLFSSALLAAPINVIVTTRDGDRIALNNASFGGGATLKVVDERGISTQISLSDIQDIQVLRMENGQPFGHVLKWNSGESINNLRMHFSRVTGWENPKQQGDKISIPASQIQSIEF